jgi:hypothetical protein
MVVAVSSAQAGERWSEVIAGETDVTGEVPDVALHRCSSEVVD